MARVSTVADHCIQYALSDPKDRDYQVVCAHHHCGSCDCCALLSTALSEIDDALAKMSAENMLEDDREQIMFVATQAKQNILSWKAHLIRSINQDEARLDVLQDLDQSSILLIQDWAMKFLPRKFRESQTDWFAKRGLSWHISVATRRMSNQEFEMMSFVHIFQACNQDSGAVLAIMDDVIGKLKSVMPGLQTVFYRQDNAGCYRCGSTIVSASKAGQRDGVSVRRLDFCDPQGGKGACDRKAASIKAHMRIHLNEGHDIESGEQMVSAMKSAGGVAGLNVTLCDASPFSPSVKLDGVSSISNVQYSQSSLRIWKAYNIGPGKTIDLRKMVMTKNMANTRFLAVSDEVSDKFCARPQTKAGKKAASATTSDTGAELADHTESQLFCCPEEGCIKSYQRLSSLQHHLYCGKHVRMLERQTLLDNAVLEYASQLQGQQTFAPKLKESGLQQLDQPSLQMGWALRSTQAGTRARFSDKQREYFTSKFQIGEVTGRKFDPTAVAKSMMTAKNANGERLFSSSEFLTSQQISGVFSRLASKKKLAGQDHDDHDLDDERSQENEAVFAGLKDKVMDEVMIRHPIYYDNHNICKLAATDKLSKFSVGMLNDICE